MKTKRKYAHDLYPHPNEAETRPLSVEVPYLYARATGLDVWGTDWFDLGRVDGDRAKKALAGNRMLELIAARQHALLADAIHQGITGQDAWEWATSHLDESGEWVYDRAQHYGVPIDAIKPYPVLDEPDYHDHLGEPDPRGWRKSTRVSGKESECEECCEPPDPREPGPNDVAMFDVQGASHADPS